MSSSKGEVATRKRWRGAKFQGRESEHKTGWNERWVQSAHVVQTPYIIQPCRLVNIFKPSCLYIVFEDTRNPVTERCGGLQQPTYPTSPARQRYRAMHSGSSIDLHREGCGQNFARPCVGMLPII